MRARREAQAQDYPLYNSPPPFDTYANWFNVPEVAGEWFEYPAPPGLLSDGAKSMMDTLIKLGPRYRNTVPEAALYLDRQIEAGTLMLAVTGDPERATTISVAEMAASMDPESEAMQQLRLRHPEIGDSTASVPLDEVGLYIHELHSKGALVLDNNHVVHLARPPQTRGEKWVFSGHLTE
ncbi:hypothetical protein [Nocardia sp. NPDC050435]|uniref:hypothetical protein n=1 Tax=Nocardia sp. NPDC050435 TaxID=3155040 RepID=UPI0033C3FA2D